MLTLVCNSAVIGLLSFVFCDFLTQDGQILSLYGRMLEWLYQRRIMWLAKPLGWCGKCFAGQLALWSYPVWSQDLSYLCGHWINPQHPPIHHWATNLNPWQYLLHCESYHPIGHIVAIAMSITSYIIIHACLKRYL